MSTHRSRDDLYYQAMLARDSRFDGKFYVGVRTTGIYCRPICPARPLRKNVEFFASHLLAEKAGYRPCMRCRPESAPRSPVWIGKSAIVRRALKALGDERTLELDEDRFAALFGVSARHLRRVFVEEVGKTPKQLSFETRLNLARKLLTETSLPVTEVAFASGFNSIRRFNDAFRDRFGRSPSSLRRQRAGAAGAPLRVSLSYRPPYDFEGLLAFYRSHAVGRLEAFEAGPEGPCYRRVVDMGGKTGAIRVWNEGARSRLVVEIDFPDASWIHAILARVRGMFDLDSDPVVIANALEACDPAVGRILPRHAGIRLPSGWDPFEVSVASILGQLVSVERGRALVCDLIELTGRDSGLRAEGVPIRLFPSPADIAKADLSKLKTTGARKATLREFARRVASGGISLELTQDVDRFVEQVRSVRGIGPWTASYMAMKALRHTDAFPETDLILARAIALHSANAVAKSRPWSGYLAALFWREYAQALKKGPRKGEKRK